MVPFVPVGELPKQKVATEVLLRWTAELLASLWANDYSLEHTEKEALATHSRQGTVDQ